MNAGLSVPYTSIRPVNQSTNQPINQSTSQPPVNAGLSVPYTSQPINQSTNQPVNQSTNRPINQSTSQPPVNAGQDVLMTKSGRHFANRRADMSYLIYDEELPGMVDYPGELKAYIEWLRATFTSGLE